MPATLPHGAILPISAPPVDPRLRRRPIPAELAALERDQSLSGKALWKLVQDIYQPEVGIYEREEAFRHRVTEAINQIGQAAFTPRTTISYCGGDEKINDTPWVDISAMAQIVALPVPGRIHLILNLCLLTTVASNFFLNLRIWDGTIARAEGQFRVPAGGTLLQWSATLQDLFDAQPRTAYTLTPQASVEAIGPEYWILAGANNNLSTFTVRVEPRSLRETTP